jgi:hypothetical protein
LHQGPTVRLLGAPTIAPVMLAALLTGVAAFTLAYVYMVALRLRVGRLEDRAMAEALSPRIGRPVERILEDDDLDPEPARG